MRMAGPMGRSVDDIARLLTVLARQDERDTWSLPADGVRYHDRLGRGPLVFIHSERQGDLGQLLLQGTHRSGQAPQLG